MKTRNLVALAILAGFLTALLFHDAKAHVAGCHTTACDRRIHKKRAAAWCKRTPRCVWKHRWQAEERHWRAWLRSTAWCESRNRAHIATGNGYFGLVQFSWPTARAAGFTRYPHLTSWYEQAVRAIEFAKVHGTQHWPVCGR